MGEINAGTQRDAHAPRWDDIASAFGQRPWPPPHGPWIISQTWRDLLFAHWPVAPALLRARLPSGLVLDTFAGEAWLGVIPFQIAHLAPRGLPARMRFAFPELNVRTYVVAEDKPGVWFFSLDAASLLAVLSARVAVHLPYYWARMQQRNDGCWITYASHRRLAGAPPAKFIGRYRPVGPEFLSEPGTLVDWLTARYCLYATDRSGRIYRTEIHHASWPLQPAEAEISINTMAAVHGRKLSGPPLLHFARHLDVVTWTPQLLPR